MLQPNTLLANEVTVGATSSRVVQLPGGFGQVRPEGFVSEHRLAVQGESVASRARYAFRLQRVDDRGAWSTESIAVESQHEQVVAMPRAISRALLRMDARQIEKAGC